MYFLIPVRSAKTTTNWKKVCLLLSNTLDSIFNQEDDHFKIGIACHEIPDIEHIQHPCVHTIQLDYPVPKTHEERMADKYYKKRALTHYVRNEGGGTIMFVDADDLISNKILSYVKKHSHYDGFYIKKGFLFMEDRNKLIPAPRFMQICGTSFIVNFNREELPDRFEFEGYKRINRFLFDYGHHEWLNLYRKNHKKMKALPFRAAIYRSHTGENASLHDFGIFRRIYNKMIPVVRNRTKIFEEFKLPKA